MARPRKRKRICGLPNFKIFGPLNRGLEQKEVIFMTVEEYEVIHLMDFQRLDQEQCAERMDVSRSTVQRMYNDARQKIAASLVKGMFLKIEGGDYVLCGISENSCSPCFRKRHRHGRGKEV